jgi:hypothetical protein
MLRTSLTFHNNFQSLHFSRGQRGQNRLNSRKQSVQQNKGDNFYIRHTDSLAANDGGEDLIDGDKLSKSYKSALPPRDTIEEDLMYISMEEKRLNPNGQNPFSWINWQSHSPTPSNTFKRDRDSYQQESPLERSSPITGRGQLVSKQSMVDIDAEDEPEPMVRSIEIPSMEIPDLIFRVHINEIDDEDYTPPNKIAKELLEDIDNQEKEPTFNISLLETEKQR